VLVDSATKIITLIANSHATCCANFPSMAYTLDIRLFLIPDLERSRLSPFVVS
jgi:hypothetical protein